MIERSIVRIWSAIALGMIAVGTVQASAQFALGTTITSYGVYASGAYINFSPAQPGLEGCIYATGNELWIDFAQPEGKSLYATFLAAVLAGKPVGFGVSGCGDAGQLPLVYRVDVGP